ncbi:MAG: sigma-54-dependent Fis family transcriptional regulator [Deltaproteobacteria bacterium]|nr:sigma-54-dependent Fis family transcriptional regulator [Deltaproteobacteria bacterium]
MSKGKVLVVDDDRSLRQFLSIWLKREGYAVRAAASGRDGLHEMTRDPADVVLTDLTMEGIDGMGVLTGVKEHWPDTEVVMITAYGTTENAVQAMRHGAYDYITKPFNVDELKLVLDKCFEKQAMRTENTALRRLLVDRFGYGSMVGRSAPMAAVYDLMDRVKDTPVSVLVTGESGTGKELVARALHYEGERREAPFRSINCGAIPENLIESELFGYKKGAFTGANKDHPGLFASADGGTLFLDEIGEMPLATQVKVLRALQERKVRPVGGSEEVSVDVRLVAATNRDLPAEVAAGRFREDLYYRLNVVTIALPALRERLGDLPMLVEHFVEKYGEQFGRPGISVGAEALRALAGHTWPGNVRELENAVQRGVALSRGDVVTPDALPPEVVGPAGDVGALPSSVPPEGMDLDGALERYELMLIESALEVSGGVKTEAAKLLRITFRSLRYRLQKIGIEEPPTRG